MATVARRRMLVRNPAAKRSSAGKSLKQKLFFGTKRQRAAAKVALARKRAGKKAAATRRKKTSGQARRNPGTLTSLGLAALNPHKQRSSTVKRKQKRRRPAMQAKRRSYPARARNPQSQRRQRPRRRAVRRNPSMIGTGRIQGLVIDSVWAIGGAAGTRALTQMGLGGRNSGAIGYAANAGVALALGMLGGKTFGKRAGDMLTLGGFVGLVMRVISEQTTIGIQLGRTTRGMGDLAFAGMRGGSLRGGFERMDFLTPLASADPTGLTPASKVPAMISDAMAPPPGAGVSGLSTGRSRYGGTRNWG